VVSKGIASKNGQEVNWSNNIHKPFPLDFSNIIDLYSCVYPLHVKVYG
jgi:hypothetical protein